MSRMQKIPQLLDSVVCSRKLNVTIYMKFDDTNNGNNEMQLNFLFPTNSHSTNFVECKKFRVAKAKPQ